MELLRLKIVGCRLKITDRDVRRSTRVAKGLGCGRGERDSRIKK